METTITAIGFVNSQANGGNSTSQLSYIFNDNNITGSLQFYRLRQVDFDNHSKLSNIVRIKGEKPVTLTIDGLFPNPASNVVNVLINAPNKDKVTLIDHRYCRQNYDSKSGEYRNRQQYDTGGHQPPDQGHLYGETCLWK